MKEIKKKFGKMFASVLSLLVFCSIVPLPIHAGTNDEVWVNGVNIVTAVNNTVQCGSGTAVYDNKTNTLTLNNAQITERNKPGYVIDNKRDMDFKIILNGSNSIDNSETTGIYASTESVMIFSGDGSLDIKSKANISNKKNIIFDNVTITATAREEGSIVSNGNIIIKNGSDITCNGNYFGFNAIGNVTITGSNVKASSLSNAFSVEGNITIEQNSNVTATSNSVALYSVNDINISDSTVDATATVKQQGIRAMNNLAITGASEVIAKGQSISIMGINSFKITPPLNETVEVFLGPDSSNVTALEGSPFSVETDLNALSAGTDFYFHSKVHTHVASTTWSKDDINHWHECTANDGKKMDLVAHTFGEWVIDTAATETTKGSKHRDCTVCGQRETAEIPVLTHTHTPVTEWSKDDTNHWHECTANDGKKMDLAAHTFGEWVIDIAATETTKGSKHRDCTVCGQRKTAEISAIAVTPAKPSTPETGDTSNNMLFLGLIVLSGCAAGFGLKNKKHSRM
ncbi:MAG: LPXTG cell wall anchor domain-containing protein [Erysipelotrichaceae bacterium]